MKRIIATVGSLGVAAGLFLVAPTLSAPAPTDTSVQAGTVTNGGFSGHKGCSRPYTRYTDQYGRAYRIC